MRVIIGSHSASIRNMIVAEIRFGGVHRQAYFYRNRRMFHSRAVYQIEIKCAASRI
jgi:hypothetical protein